MAELVFQNSNGNDVTTSLLVAEVFGKEHSKVVRDIESLSCSASFNAANFGVITYIDSRNREQTAYEMTKDGFSFLVMGYTGAKAGEFKEKFINEFNRREALLKDDDYILMRSQQILQKRVEIAEQKIRQLEEKNAKLKPKADFAEAAFKKILFSFGNLLNCCTFAVRQFYIHIWIGDFLCPILNYCPKYKQRFLRTYSPQADMELSQVGEILCFLYLLTFNFHCLCDS